MKIDNKTVWDTRALRSAVVRAARGEFDPADIDRFRLRIIYSRSDRYSGYAYLNSRSAVVRVPRPLHPKRFCDVWAKAGKTLPQRTFATSIFVYVVLHEMAHAIRGLHHREMGRGWRADSPALEWAKAVKVEARIPTAKPKPDLNEKREARREHALAKAAEWKRKADRALRAAQKWNRMAVRAERAMALAASRPKEPETND
jgi:hypothetical protein